MIVLKPDVGFRRMHVYVKFVKRHIDFDDVQRITTLHQKRFVSLLDRGRNCSVFDNAPVDNRRLV